MLLLVIATQTLFAGVFKKNYDVIFNVKKGDSKQEVFIYEIGITSIRSTLQLLVLWKMGSDFEYIVEQTVMAFNNDFKKEILKEQSLQGKSNQEKTSLYSNN